MRNPRAQMTAALKSAWESTIARYYNIEGNSPIVSSEAALQAYLLLELTAAIDVLEKSGGMPPNTRVFIEPSISLSSIIPDMIVCRDKSVIAVIELKYTPRLTLAKDEENLRLGLKKDLDNFRCLYDLTQNGDGISPEFTHERYLGEFGGDFETFVFSKQTLFVWAGVHNSADLSLKKDPRSRVTLQSMPVFEMHAYTEEGKKARPAYFFDGKED